IAEIGRSSAGELTQRQCPLAIDEVCRFGHFDDDVAILYVLHRVASTMDREQGLAYARDGLGLQDLINQPPSGFSSLSLNPAVAKGSAVWPHVPIPHWGSRLGQCLAYDSPIDVRKSDRGPVEIYAQDRRDVAASCREVESRLQFVHEGDSVSAEVFAHSDPAVMVHDHNLEPAPRQKRVRRHPARPRPDLSESHHEQPFPSHAAQSNPLPRPPYPP